MFQAFNRLAIVWFLVMTTLFAYVVHLDGGTVPATANWPVIVIIMFGPLAFVRVLHWIVRGPSR